MQKLRNLIITFSLLFIIVNLIEYDQVFSLNNTTIIVKNNQWISERDNLNITIDLVPKIPVIDENTKISFEIRNLDNSETFEDFEDLNTKVTMTDHDGRLYKFENKLIPIINGKFSVDYIFPDDDEHRIILQLYQNTTPFTVGSFDMIIPHPTPPSQSDKLLSPFTDLFNSLLQVLFR